MYNLTLKQYEQIGKLAELTVQGKRPNDLTMPQHIGGPVGVSYYQECIARFTDPLPSDLARIKEVKCVSA